MLSPASIAALLLKEPRVFPERGGLAGARQLQQLILELLSGCWCKGGFQSAPVEWKMMGFGSVPAGRGRAACVHVCCFPELVLQQKDQQRSLCCFLEPDPWVSISYMKVLLDPGIPQCKYALD